MPTAMKNVQIANSTQTIVEPYPSTELDKCANDCKRLFSRTGLIARVYPKR